MPFLAQLRSPNALLSMRDIQLGYCIETARCSEDRPVFFWESLKDRWVNHLLAETLKQLLGMDQAPGYWARIGRGKDAAIQEYLNHRDEYPFLFKTDVRSYFDSCNQEQIYASIKRELFQHRELAVEDRDVILNLLSQTLTPRVIRGQERRIDYFRRGLPKGFSTSPVLAWWALQKMDQACLSLPGVRYLRFVDDVLIIAKRDEQLRLAKKVFFSQLNAHQFRIRPKKTFTGTAEDKLVYLGYVIWPGGFAVADTSIKRLKENLRKKPQAEWAEYLKHWSAAFKRVPKYHLERLMRKAQRQIRMEREAEMPEPQAPVEILNTEKASDGAENVEPIPLKARSPFCSNRATLVVRLFSGPKHYEEPFIRIRGPPHGSVRIHRYWLKINEKIKVKASIFASCISQ